jgi:hypothetical protein
MDAVQASNQKVSPDVFGSLGDVFPCSLPLMGIAGLVKVPGRRLVGSGPQRGHMPICFQRFQAHMTPHNIARPLGKQFRIGRFRRVIGTEEAAVGAAVGRGIDDRSKKAGRRNSFSSRQLQH